MTVAATIACRANSTRLYNKPLQSLGGKVILDHIIDRLRSVSLIDGVVLAISENPENDVFVRYAEQRKLPFILGDERDVLGRLIKAADAVGADTVVRVTSDCPLIHLDIDTIIKHHQKTHADLTFISKLPLGCIVEVISLSALRLSHARGDARHRSELVTLYINEHPDLFRIEILEPPHELQRPEIVLTVDTAQDLERMQIIYRELHGDTKLIDVRDVIVFLDAHPEYKTIYQKAERPHARVWE